MPIIIKDFTWDQTLSHVYVTVPLKGANPKKTDVYVNDVYLKVNFPPYFFELDLYAEVDSEHALATVGGGCATFELPKQSSMKWPSITPTELTPETTKTRRSQAEQAFHAREEQKAETKRIEKRQEEQYLIQKQIEVERRARENVEALKAQEKRVAEEEMRVWAEKVKQQRRGGGGAAIRRGSADETIEGSRITEIFSDDEGEDDGDVSATATNAGDSLDVEEDDDESGIDMDAIRAKVQAQLQANVRTLPPPRESGDISITFTSRGLIPTKTARESEDVKWRSRIKAAQDDYQRKTRNPDDERGIEESSPLFLKDKGNGFYKAGNFEAAVNAYTAALDLDPSNVTCLSNRAACHLHLKAHQACIDDCVGALSVLAKEEAYLRDQLIEDGGVEQRRKSRVKLLVRMGTAKAAMGDRGSALKQYQEALKLDPLNDQLRSDLERLGGTADSQM
ncbi:Dynein assembly factor 4, axonemal [Gaertneriomyces sp. JEL0708]|nr:Dynein assembly factor 4, axonemal [Gaertneriomyces sp. JEL0708]